MRFNFMISYMIAGAGAALVIALLLMGMLKFSPPAITKVQPVYKFDATIPDGIREEKDMFGLIQSRTEYRGGLPNGGALHFYPNKSVARVLEYRDGKLHGLVREYYEYGQKASFRGRGKMGMMRQAANLKLGQTGQVKAIWTYDEGIKDGPYELYYLSGGLKEQGEFIQGKPSGSPIKFKEDGTER